MLTILTLLFWLAVACGALALLGFVAGRLLSVERQPDAVHFAQTEDGWRLGLARYRPQRPIGGAPPVVLCPGFALSAAIYDLFPETSLARYLASFGYDVWLLDLRGRGYSERPRFGGRRRYTWAFDDYVELDLPAAIDAICRETGARAVQWIGLDLGALVPLAALTRGGAARVASLAALAAPAIFRRQAALLPRWVLRALRLVRIEAALRLAAPLLGRLFPPPLSLWQNRDNIDSPAYRRLLINACCSFSRRELAQYREWLAGDLFQALDGARDYRKGLSSLALPCLLLYGPRDPLAPPEAMEATADALPGVEDKVVVVASRMHGMSANYGHLDLLAARTAPRDIYPHLLKWLDLHAGVPVPAGRPEPGHATHGDELEAWHKVTPRAPAPAPQEAPPSASSASADALAPSAAATATDPRPAAATSDENADEDAPDDIEWTDGDARVPK